MLNRTHKLFARLTSSKADWTATTGRQRSRQLRVRPLLSDRRCRTRFLGKHCNQDIFLVTFLIISRSPAVNHIACTLLARPAAQLHTQHLESGTTSLSTAILASPIIRHLLQVISYVLEPQVEFCCGGDSVQAVIGVSKSYNTRE